MKLSLQRTRVKTKKKIVLDTTKLVVLLFGGLFLSILVIAIAKHNDVDEELLVNEEKEVVEVPLPAGYLPENECIKYSADDCPSGCEICIPDPLFKAQACHSEDVCEQLQVYLDWLEKLKENLE